MRRLKGHNPEPPGLIFKGIPGFIKGMVKIRQGEKRGNLRVGSRLFKAVILGILTAAVGVIGSFVPFGLDLEENVGLDLLFSLRGMRQPPPEVRIVTLDQKSAANLNLPKEPRKWPRSLHANLIENLIQKGATVIAFDLSFEESRSNEDDKVFAEAIHKAGNVVLCEYLKKEKASLSDHRGSPAGSLNIERMVPPIPQLANSAVALAPFPLPKVPVRVSRYWAFKSEAGETPTLPVVVLQIFTMNVYGEFKQLLEKANSSRAFGPLPDSDAMISTRSVEKAIRDIRGIFENDPFLGERMLKELQNGGARSMDPKRIQILKSLIKMYHSPESPYINFYGPPGTIPTIPYYQVLKLQEKSAPPREWLDFSGKAVFVGLSESLPPEQRDGFHTVFSQASGSDITGVEVAATAFANLLEDRPVQPQNLWSHLAVASLWGVVIGMVWYLLPTLAAVLSAIGLAVFYLGVSAYQFKTTGSWYPLVVPLFIQCPLAFVGAVVWKSVNIKRGLRYYLPERVIKQIERNARDLEASKELVYGTIMCTDVEKYSAVTEAMNPERLRTFMNTYWEFLSKPIHHHQGTVLNIVGDSVFALWKAKEPDFASRKKACLAALDIIRAVDQFNQFSGEQKLPTRIGLHSGYVLLGNIIAVDHYEYRPIGDIPVIASRIEGLNKHLGTRILVSEEVIHQLDGFFTRGLGKFRPVGKTKPLSIHELVCRVEESSEQQKEQCVKFAETLEAFRRRSWIEAEEKFKESKTCGGDGPSAFYAKQCSKYREEPPEEPWDGVIGMEEK